jgi:hypothetical protein
MSCHTLPAGALKHEQVDQLAASRSRRPSSQSSAQRHRRGLAFSRRSVTIIGQTDSDFGVSGDDINRPRARRPHAVRVGRQKGPRAGRRATPRGASRA